MEEIGKKLNLKQDRAVMRAIVEEMKSAFGIFSLGAARVIMQAFT